MLFIPVNKRGFSLIEILLSISIISILIGIGVPIYQSFQNRNELDIAVVTFAQNARRAQFLARASDGDTNWGVFVTTTTLTLFQGTSYANRVTSTEELYPISILNTSGTTEYVFSRFTGYPQFIGTTTLISINNETRTISINEKGTVTY